MPIPTITQAAVWEDAGAVLMARIRGNDGAHILKANTSSIELQVWDISTTPSTPFIVGSPTALTVASVVFDTLQTGDVRWTETQDVTGYNFLYTLPASFLPEPQTYIAEIVFTPASGDVFPAVYQLPAKGLHSS